MFLDRTIYLSEILENPEGMQQVEDSYVLVMEDASYSWQDPSPKHHKDMMNVINMLHGQGWEIVNMAFYVPSLMAVLVKNPHAKRKNEDNA